MSNTKISAVIITKNEERNIERCLKSLRNVVDEVIVIDAFSTDATEEICKSYGGYFYQHLWQGYSDAKNYGNSLATNKYILSIDADEVLSDELKESIKEAKKNLHGVYSFNRHLNYCGQWINHCGWYPDTKVRLFPKSDAHWNNAKVHERIEFSPVSISHLTGDLYHYSYYTLSEHISRCNYYTDISSEKYQNKSEALLVFKMIFSPIFRFIVSYFFKLGFLDGVYGFFICSMQGFDIFIKYQKAIQMKKAFANKKIQQSEIVPEYSEEKFSISH